MTQNAAASTTPPTIAINGANRAIIHIVDSYTDLGATAVDHAGTYLSVKTV